MRKILSIIIAIGFLIIIADTVMAQEGQRTITIVPPTVKKTLDPGAKTEGVMKVINDSNETLTFAVSVQDYVVIDKKGTPNILPPNTLNGKYSAASWIGVTPDTFTIEPHQKQTLNYYLQIPADASPGGHYAAVVYAPTTPGERMQTSGASVRTQTGTLFYIDVNGDVMEKAKVVNFLANSFQEYGPVKISTEIQNMGDLHITPDGQIVVKDLLGRTISNTKLDTHNIYPGNKSYQYENTIGQNLMIGRFEAILLASYGKTKNLPLMSTVYFYVFPWKVAAVIVLIIIAAILGMKLMKKKKGNEPKQTAEVKNETPLVSK